MRAKRITECLPKCLELAGLLGHDYIGVVKSAGSLHRDGFRVLFEADSLEAIERMAERSKTSCRVYYRLPKRQREKLARWSLVKEISLAQKPATV